MLTEARVNVPAVAPGIYKAMSGLEAYLGHCSLDSRLIDLLKLRASQLNGCAYCIDMHWKDLRAAGETEQRLYGLDAWRESSYYTDRERADLEWTEAVTLIHTDHVPDLIYDAVSEQFTEQEMADLTFAIAAINAWNRLAIALRAVPGHYKPSAHAKAHA